MEGEGAERFAFHVCSPAWLAQATAKDKIIFGKYFIVMDYFHFPTLYDALQRLCHRTKGKNWAEIAQKLARYGGWEFEE